VVSAAEDMCSKVFNIFIERSSALYSDEEVLMWLREIIGFSLNKLDSGELVDPQILIAQL